MAIAKNIREQFAGCTTRGCEGYYATKGHAVSAFDAALKAHALEFDRNEFLALDGDAGRVLWSIVNEFNSVVGRALLTWYRMPSGRYEFVGYTA